MNQNGALPNRVRRSILTEVYAFYFTPTST
jgi:hypothetical protein